MLNERASLIKWIETKIPTESSTINNVGGYDSTATSITVSTIKPPAIGATFTIATETGTPTHTVTGATATSLTFTPAITGTVAHGDTVTIKPYFVSDRSKAWKAPCWVFHGLDVKFFVRGVEFIPVQINYYRDDADIVKAAKDTAAFLNAIGLDKGQESAAINCLDYAGGGGGFTKQMQLKLLTGDKFIEAPSIIQNSPNIINLLLSLQLIY